MTPLSRRGLLKAGAAVSGAMALGGERLLEQAQAIEPAGSSLHDVEHVVIVMQENRSFDHYFGTMSGVRGFSDPHALPGVFKQKGYRPGKGADPTGYLQPWHIKGRSDNGQTTNDITHNWAPQHHTWNNGKMDGWMQQHLAEDGPDNAPLTMGYYTREDIPFFFALADAFTVLDGYHCSVIGPTDPNRLFWMTASLGADGTKGDPMLYTHVADRPTYYGTLDWETMPERLSDAGVSWKVYQDASSNVLFNVLPYFKSFTQPTSVRGIELARRGLEPVYPAEFVADVAAGTLPSVSWIMPPFVCCEHPAVPPAYGEWFIAQVVDTLVSNPEVWAKTVLMVVYDENGGFFDHVVPPTPGPQVVGSKHIPTSDFYLGEYVTPERSVGGRADAWGPVGLGFRTPAMVISPFSRGGWVSSETLDHTSTLRFIEKRWGVEVPNLSGWRRSVTGDMSRTLPLLKHPDMSVPKLPATSLGDVEIAQQVLMNSLLGTADEGAIYPPPTSNSMPKQESTPVRKRIKH